METLGFYFDMAKCIGCRACQVACKDKNRLDVGVVYRNAHTYVVGAYPSVKCYSYAATCYHCASPACVESCPTGSMHISDDGTVQNDESQCIGCGSCVNACPYGNPKLLEHKVAGKCDSCKAIRAAGGNPVCVDACPMRALDFGNLDDLRAKYGEGVCDLAVLPDSAATQPRLLIRAKSSALESDFKELTY